MTDTDQVNRLDFGIKETFEDFAFAAPDAEYRIVSYNFEKIVHKSGIWMDRLVISFHGLRIKAFDIPKFRGYLAARYRQFDLIHNHLGNGVFRYAYPVIQFKIIDSNPAIVGIADGIDILKQVFLDIDELKINGSIQEIGEKSVVLEKVDFGQTETMHRYRFVSPWMALNTENFKKYAASEWHERRGLLETILARN